LLDLAGEELVIEDKAVEREEKLLFDTVETVRDLKQLLAENYLTSA
jgi:hypothetical protein